MMYSEYMIKAKELTIVEADNGLFYLEPEWHNILMDNKMILKTITDAKASWNDVEDILKLEVEKRNAVNSKKPFVINWLYELITSQVDPAMLAEETEYLKNMMEYMKLSKEN